MAEKFEAEGATLTLFPNAPDWDGCATAAIGKFRCDTARAGAALIRQMEREARARGLTTLIGPMDGDTWHPCRLITETDGRAPFLMEPTGGPHDLAAFEAAGFVPIGRYVSASLALSGVDAPGPLAQNDLGVESWDGTDAEGLFAQVHDLSSQAFAGNPSYRPLPLDDFLAIYLPMVPLLRPELILFARDGDGTLAGFLFGIPNYAEGPTPDAAILKTYASLQKGAGRMLSAGFYAAARALGFRTVIHALMHDDNPSAGRSALNGARVFRRYALMGRRLD